MPPLIANLLSSGMGRRTKRDKKEKADFSFQPIQPSLLSGAREKDKFHSIGMDSM